MLTLEQVISELTKAYQSKTTMTITKTYNLGLDTQYQTISDALSALESDINAKVCAVRWTRREGYAELVVGLAPSQQIWEKIYGR